MAKTILIVDDSVSLRQVVAIALTSAGYEVIEACDGKDALAKLTGQKVHLMISDVNMPNMDGITFLKEVRANPVYKFTPVIMLTTTDDPLEVAACYAAGCNFYITKPRSFEDFAETLSRLGRFLTVLQVAEP